MAAKPTIRVREISTIKPGDRIDVRGAKAEYGQMVALGRLIDAEYKRREKGEEDQDFKFAKDILRVLHPDIDPAPTYDNIRYAYDIVEAAQFWKRQESERLKYDPSTEEKQAGFEQLAKTTGPRGVAVSIGKDFSVHPDEVFKWSFGSVFTVLEVDLERYKYSRRLQEIRDKKRKQEERRRRR